MRPFVVLAGWIVLVAASQAAATLLYYDPFLIDNNPAAGQYTLGPIAGQNPTVGPTPFLAGPWVVQENAPNVVVQSEGLTYLGGAAQGGSVLTTPNGRPRRFLSSPWTPATTGTYFISFAVNFGQGNYADGIEGNDMGYRALEFWQDTGGFAMNIAYNTFSSAIGQEQRDPRTARMFLGLNGDQILENSPPSFMEDGATHLLVVRFNLSDQAASDSIVVHLDPTSTVEPDLPGATVSGIDFTLGAFGAVSLFGGSGVLPVYDEVRVATTFSEAIPPVPRPGDTNGDGLVDLVDYNNIVTHFNQQVLSPLEGDVAKADGSQGSDGRVTLGDFRIWRNNRTDIPALPDKEASIGIPEPTSMALALAFAVAMADRRNRNGRRGEFKRAQRLIDRT